jgi:hypothetical protein
VVGITIFLGKAGKKTPGESRSFGGLFFSSINHKPHRGSILAKFLFQERKDKFDSRQLTAVVRIVHISRRLLAAGYLILAYRIFFGLFAKSQILSS